MAVVKLFGWQKLPALRVLIPFMAGIVLQWYTSLPIAFISICIIFSFAAILLLQQTSLLSRFRHRLAPGLLLNLLMITTGCLVMWCKDIRNYTGKNLENPSPVILTIDEPPSEKQNVMRAIAKINFISSDRKYIHSTGKVILSFPKEFRSVEYGSRLLVKKPFREIKNSGNPGSFDYKTYCLFQGITHQVYLEQNDFILLPGRHGNLFFEKIYRCRSYIVSVFKKYIPGGKEQGLAEALLIGYKDDLDRDLVKAYSNTGVVHIIAISGLHLALIYGLLMMITIPMKKNLKWLRFIIVVSGLWIFSVLAGAQPSILRAAVMFTAIALQMLVARKGFIFNSIALAAFVLLCYNPFWLWDAGFQLSFLAVLSIIIFYKPIYNLIYIQNKSIDYVWKLAAASLAAQVLTIPVTLYYFHQFPFIFLLTNIVAVPLSGIIVYAEILLCAVSFSPWLAAPVGRLVTILIRFMNSHVERMNELPFALWSGISISAFQAFLLYGVILGFCYWLLKHYKPAFYFGLISLTGFMILRSFSFFQTNRQQLLIVYNIPKHKAIDIINGRECLFAGDISFSENNGNENGIIQSCRMEARVSRVYPSATAIQFGNKHILIADSLTDLAATPATAVDLLIISGKTKLRIDSRFKNVVLDGTVPGWKATKFKAECERLNIPCYNVVEKGAFVVNPDCLPLPPP